jgi:nicotinamidase-related amidase
MTIDQLGPKMIGLVPDLAKFVPPARTFDKLYSPWTGSDLHQTLRSAEIDTIIITGGETDVCVAEHYVRGHRLGVPRQLGHRCRLQFGG